MAYDLPVAASRQPIMQTKGCGTISRGPFYFLRRAGIAEDG